MTPELKIIKDALQKSRPHVSSDRNRSILDRSSKWERNADEALASIDNALAILATIEGEGAAPQPAKALTDEEVVLRGQLAQVHAELTETKDQVRDLQMKIGFYRCAGRQGQPIGNWMELNEPKEWEPLVTYGTSCDWIQSLYEHIAHGDAEHRSWLLKEMRSWSGTGLPQTTEERYLAPAPPVDIERIMEVYEIEIGNSKGLTARRFRAALTNALTQKP